MEIMRCLIAIVESANVGKEGPNDIYLGNWYFQQLHRICEVEIWKLYWHLFEAPLSSLTKCRHAIICICLSQTWQRVPTWSIYVGSVQIGTISIYGVDGIKEGHQFC